MEELHANFDAEIVRDGVMNYFRNERLCELLAKECTALIYYLIYYVIYYLL